MLWDLIDEHACSVFGMLLMIYMNSYMHDYSLGYYASCEEMYTCMYTKCDVRVDFVNN